MRITIFYLGGVAGVAIALIIAIAISMYRARSLKPFGEIPWTIVTLVAVIVCVVWPILLAYILLVDIIGNTLRKLVGKWKSRRRKLDRFKGDWEWMNKETRNMPIIKKCVSCGGPFVGGGSKCASCQAIEKQEKEREKRKR